MLARSSCNGVSTRVWTSSTPTPAPWSPSRRRSAPPWPPSSSGIGTPARLRVGGRRRRPLRPRRHRRPRRRPGDQRARRRLGPRRARGVRRRHRVEVRRGRRGRAVRSRGAAVPAVPPPSAATLGNADTLRGGAARGGRRQPAGAGRVGHGRRGQRAGPVGAGRGRPGQPRDRGRHPDRRGAQPRQLRRRAGRLGRAGSSGINTALAGIGLGLAIPINNTTNRIITTLLTDGRVRRAYLGVVGVPAPLPATWRARIGRATGCGSQSRRRQPGRPGRAARRVTWC